MLNDAGRAEVIAFMIERGYGDKILTGHDVASKRRLTAYGGPGYFYIVRRVVPWLEDTRVLRRGYRPTTYPQSGESVLTMAEPGR